MGHDFGRWAEERIFGNAQGGSTHSRMSYVLLKEFLEDYNFPQIIKLSLLNSVIKHTTGANSDENMHIKLTVSPDRDQLIGPEFILRLFHHKPKDNALKVFFDELKQEFFSDRPEFKEISMGMSHDYPIALKEGSTMVRVGSKIFGDRNY